MGHIQSCPKGLALRAEKGSGSGWEGMWGGTRRAQINDLMIQFKYVGKQEQIKPNQWKARNNKSSDTKVICECFKEIL